MNFYDHPETLLEDHSYRNLRISDQNKRDKRVSISGRRQCWLFFSKPLALALLLSLPSAQRPRRGACRSAS